MTTKSLAAEARGKAKAAAVDVLARLNAVQIVGAVGFVTRIAIDPEDDIRRLNSTAANVARRAEREPDAYAPPRKQEVGDGIAPIAYDKASRRAPLKELGWGHCRFPVNDPPRGGLMLFCGLAQADGSSYCAHHKLRCSGAGTLGERRALNGIARAA